MIPVKTFENPMYKGEWPIAWDRYRGQVSIQFKDTHEVLVYFKREPGRGYKWDNRFVIEPDLPKGWQPGVSMNNNLLIWPGLSAASQSRLKTLVDNADYVLTTLNDSICDCTWDDPTDKYFLQLREDVLAAGRKFLEPIKKEILILLQDADQDRARQVINDTRERSKRDANNKISELEREIEELKNGVNALNKEVI